MRMTNRSEAQIIQRIEDLQGDLALNFRQICDLLVQVRDHYLHRDRQFRHYRDVAADRLLPELVMAMGFKRGYLEHMRGRPREVQMAVARDAEFSWVCVVKGEVVERRSGWKAMGAADFKRAFPIGRPPASVSEQRGALVEEMQAKPVTHKNRQPLARVDLAAQSFRLGGQTVPLSVVLAALREAGLVCSTGRSDGAAA